MARRGVVHDSICWAVVAASLLVDAVTHYDVIGRFERTVAEMGLDLTPPTVPMPPWWMVATSGVLTVALVGLLFSRRVRTRLGLRASLAERSAGGSVYLGAVALYFAVNALGLAGWTYLDWSQWLPLWHVRWYATGAALAYAFFRCRSFATPRVEWGGTRGRGVLRELALGAVLGLVFVPALIQAEGADESVFTSYWFFSAVIAAPLIEETVYRGMLYRHLRDWWTWPVAVLASSAVFAAAHMPVGRWPWVFVIGVVFALLREWRGSLLAPIAAHAYGNLFWVLLRAP